MLPYRFDVLVDDEEEDPSSTHIVDGPLRKLEFTPNGDGIEDMNLIITEKMFRLYAGSDEIDLINDLPLVQFPIAAIETIVQTILNEKVMDLKIDNKRGLEFSKNKFLVQLRDDFLPIYLSPAFGKMGLTCDPAEVETSESIEFLVAAFKTLHKMVLDHTWEPQTLDEYQMQQKVESNMELRHYLLSRMLIFNIEHEEFKTLTM